MAIPWVTLVVTPLAPAGVGGARRCGTSGSGLRPLAALLRAGRAAVCHLVRCSPRRCVAGVSGARRRFAGGRALFWACGGLLACLCCCRCCCGWRQPGRRRVRADRRRHRQRKRGVECAPPATRRCTTCRTAPPPTATPAARRRCCWAPDERMAHTLVLSHRRTTGPHRRCPRGAGVMTCRPMRPAGAPHRGRASSWQALRGTVTAAARRASCGVMAQALWRCCTRWRADYGTGLRHCAEPRALRGQRVACSPARGDIEAAQVRTRWWRCRGPAEGRRLGCRCRTTVRASSSTPAFLDAVAAAHSRWRSAGTATASAARHPGGSRCYR